MRKGPIIQPSTILARNFSIENMELNYFIIKLVFNMHWRHAKKKLSFKWILITSSSIDNNNNKRTNGKVVFQCKIIICIHHSSDFRNRKKIQVWAVKALNISSRSFVKWIKGRTSRLIGRLKKPLLHSNTTESINSSIYWLLTPIQSQKSKIMIREFQYNPVIHAFQKNRIANWTNFIIFRFFFILNMFSSEPWTIVQTIIIVMQ